MQCVQYGPGQSGCEAELQAGTGALFDVGGCVQGCRIGCGATGGTCSQGMQHACHICLSHMLHTICCRGFCCHLSRSREHLRALCDSRGRACWLWWCDAGCLDEYRNCEAIGPGAAACRQEIALGVGILAGFCVMVRGPIRCRGAPIRIPTPRRYAKHAHVHVLAVALSVRAARR